MKVIHLPCDVGGNAWGLAQGEKLLGLESDVFYTHKSRIGYPCSHSLNLDHDGSRFQRIIKEIQAFFKIRSEYDVFHFNFGATLLSFSSYDWIRYIDLHGYPKKAKLFMTYQGCDARQKFPSMQRTTISPCQNSECTNNLCDYGRKDSVRKKCIEEMNYHVDHMWALNPDLLYFLPPEKSSFLPYTVAHYRPERIPVCRRKKLTIVHAPTNQIIKGSAYVKKAVEKLSLKYPDEFEMIWIENIPHEQALEAYRQADLIIDQLLIGWYGAFAVEGMLMGKPVLVRIEEKDLHWIPSSMKQDLQESIINADPSNIEEVLERCLLEPHWLQQRAENCFAYAQKWHNPTYVASLTKEKYEHN